MTWIRPQATRGSGRSALLLLSVLALLALACFPVLAQADSGTIQYDPSLPSPGGGAKQNENIAKSSESPKTGGAEAPPSTGTSEGYVEQGPPSSEGQSNTNVGAERGPSQGSPDKGNNPPGGAKVHPATPQHVQSTPKASDDGSSPLVPILIAVAVLAAISIGALLIRQRRQRDGSSPSLSTKAG